MKLSSISRRTALKGFAATGLTMAASGRAFAQEVTLRWWSPQGAPAQRAAYQAQITAFEAAHPGVRVLFEAASDEGYASQLAAAFASGEVPDVITHLPSFAAQSYYSNGLVEPFDDVIVAIGEDKYYHGANDVFRAADGHYVGAGIGNTAANMLWVRRDLMSEAGIDSIPATWDELRTACQAMQKGGIYGAPLPYGRNSMTSLIFVGVIHQAGGHIFTPDLEVDLDNDHTRNALEFYRSMREFCPPGATSYSWGDSLTAFVSGATATGIYGGRVLANVVEQNPSIADQVTCAVYPTISADVQPWTFNDFPSVFIPAQSKNKDMAKKFAAFLFDPAGYIMQLHAAPGHVLPVLQTISSDERYNDNPIIKSYGKEVDLMAVAAAEGFNLGYESSAHKSNDKAGEVIAAGPLADLVQRVVVNNENVDTVIGDTTKAIQDIMSS